MRRVVGAGRRLWRAVTDPPHMRPVYAIVYAVTVLTGTATLVAPPVSLESEIGPVLAAVWAWCFIGGGMIGLATVWSDWWWLERTALTVIMVGGIGVYGLVVTLLHLQSAAGSRLTQLGVITLAGLLYVIRWVAIRTYSYAPRCREE